MTAVNSQPKSGQRPWLLRVLSTLLGCILALGLAEASLRLLARPELGGYRIGSLLVPLTWPERRELNRQQLAVLAAGDTYLVADPMLGWTVGASRSGQDEPLEEPVTYYSSAEGIRSPVQGMRYRDQRDGRRVLALVGDSFAFSLQSDFEHSIGGQLQAALGPEWLVLNFGVNGYGVDQTYLRYQKDVRPWRPDLVLFGVSNHDMVRTLAVYPFVSFRGWLPLAKPRFILQDGAPALLNVPLIDPQQILRRESVNDLPYIEYDYGYRRKGWPDRPTGGPMVWRFLKARFPTRTAPTALVNDDALMSINEALLRSVQATAANDGTVVVNLLYPATGPGDLGTGPVPETYTRKAFRAVGAPWWDLTRCLRQVPADKLLAGDDVHYSSTSNAAAARCLIPEIRAAATGALTAGELQL